MDPTHFTTIEGDRIVGHIDAGREQVGIDRLDQEPQYVAGAGFPSSPASVPFIVVVLAIGHTTAQALSRGRSVFDAFGLDQSLFVVRIAKLKPIDGQLLRITLKAARDAADPRLGTSSRLASAVVTTRFAPTAGTTSTLPPGRCSTRASRLR